MGHTPSFESVPHDILRLLVPFVRLQDYGNLRLVSRTLTNIIDNTFYGRLYRFFIYSEPDSFRMLATYIRAHPETFLTMGDFFECLRDPKCECGNFAWHLYWFSSPPVRLCLWALSQPNTKCYRPLVATQVRLFDNQTTSLCEIFNIKQTDITHLARYNQPHTATQFVDLKSVKAVARQKHGKGADDVIASADQILQNPGWALPYGPGSAQLRPVPFGLYLTTPDDGYTKCISPMQCGLCSSSQDTQDTYFPFPVDALATPKPDYEYLPHDFHFLKEHVGKHHPHELENFLRDWSAIPLSIRFRWSQEGYQPKHRGHSATYYHYNTRIPSFSNWNQIIRDMWDQDIQDYYHSNIYRRQQWTNFANQLDRAEGRNMSISAPHDIRGNREGEWSLAVEAFLVMRTRQALDELDFRWSDEQERERLWRELVTWYQFQEVYPYAPRLRY